MAGDEHNAGAVKRGAPTGWRRSGELLVAVLLGALPSLAALSSGGHEWAQRLPIFAATGLLGILAVALFPSSAWHLHVSDKVLLFAGMCMALFLLALDMSGLVLVMGSEGEEVVFRRNGWAGGSRFCAWVCYGLCLWIGQIVVRRHNKGREWIAGGLLGFGLAYCVARTLWAGGQQAFPGAGPTGFTNRNAFAHFALLHASVALGLLYAQGERRQGGRWLRILLLLSAGALGLAAAATTSRGALLAWAAVLACWLLLMRRSLVARGGFIGVAAMLVLVTAAAWFGPEVLKRFEGEQLSFLTRLAVWQKSLALSLHSPWLGFGPESFSDAFNCRYDLGGAKVFTHAEQSYLTCAVESGWLLLGLVMGWLVWNLWESWRLRRESWRGFCMVSLPLALFLLHGFVESLWRFPAILLAVTLVLAFNRGRSTLPHRGLRRPSPGPWNLLALAGSLVLLVAAGFGHLLHRNYQRALLALDAGLIPQAREATEKILGTSLDERLWLMRLGSRWITYLDRTGAQDEEYRLLVRRIGDELIRRQPSHWESWVMWIWPRFEDKSQETEIVFGVRKALTCLSHWEPLYIRLVKDVSRYAPDSLEQVYKALPTSQQIMLWRSISGSILSMNRPFLEWAARQALPPEVESQVLGAATRFEATQTVVDGLMKAWQNPEISWPERRTVGDRLLKNMDPDKWFEAFPPDLVGNFEAQLQRLNRGMQHGLRDRVKTELLAMKLPSSVSHRRLLVQFAEMHVAAGLFERAQEICRVLLAGSQTVRSAEDRGRNLEKRYSHLDSRAAIEVLWNTSRATAAQGSWLDLLSFLVGHKEFPQAASALRQFPTINQQEDERKEYLLYKARVSEASGKAQESLSVLVQLLYLEIPL